MSLTTKYNISAKQRIPSTNLTENDYQEKLFLTPKVVYDLYLEYKNTSENQYAKDRNLNRKMGKDRQFKKKVKFER